MIRILLTTIASVMLFALGSGPLRAAADREIRWQTIDVPGATSTAIYGTNAAGDVAGSFRDARGNHGFVLSHGEYQTFDYVGADGLTAAITNVFGIGPGGDVVGMYRMQGEPAAAYHGFLRSSDGTFTALDFPGHLYTVLQKINADGTIVGCYHDNDMTDSMHAITLENGAWSALPTARTMANARTPGGKTLVGRIVDVATGRNHGWVLRDNEMTLFDVPGSLATNPLGINAAGAVVGFYSDRSLVFHGFLLQSDAFWTVDFPGALATYAWDISAGGDIVGYYVDGVTSHGFIASRTATHMQ